LLAAFQPGYALSLILIFIINQRSFRLDAAAVGRSEPHLYLAFFTAIGAALLAGVYPALPLEQNGSRGCDSK
jgi:hypothetical protein